MLQIDPGHPAGDPAEHLVGDGIGLAGDGGGVIADGAAPQDRLVVLFQVRHGADVHHHLIHAHPAQHRAGHTVDLHDALAAAEEPGVAVGVAGAQGGDPQRLVCNELAPVADRLPGLHLFDHAHHGLEGHHRAELPKPHLIAGVVAVEDDAGACHAALPGQPFRPIRVQHDPGGVVTVHQRRFLPGILQGVERLDEQGVLLGGVGDVFGTGVVCHREMLEQTGHFQPRQGADRQHLPDGSVKVRAQGKADAPHAGVRLQVDLYLSAGGKGSGAQRLCLCHGIACHGDVVGDEGGSVTGLHVSQHQNGQGLPAFAQLHRLGKAAHCQPCGAFLRKDAGALHRTVTVAVCLYHGTQGQVPGACLDDAEIIAQGIEVDLCPDMFFKGLGLHALPLPFLIL